MTVRGDSAPPNKPTLINTCISIYAAVPWTFIVHVDALPSGAVVVVVVRAARAGTVEVAEVVIVPTRAEVGPARHSGRVAIRR